MKKINKNPIVIPFDIDETLVTFIKNEERPIKMRNKKKHFMVWPLLKNIEFLKECSNRGFYVRVHSQGGHDWAAAVVKALKLEHYVDSIETKPKWYVDDLDANVWMERIDKCRGKSR